MATPTIVSNLANPSTAHNPYSEQGAWVTSTSYAVDDVVSVGGSAWVCISAHTSGASSKPPTGASYATFWNQILDIEATDVTNVTAPGATWAPTLTNGEVYYLEGANPTQVAPANNAATNKSIYVLVYVKGGSGLTWSGVTLGTNVSLSTTTSVVDLILLYDVNLNGTGQGWRVVQLDSTSAAATLPAAIDHEWPFETDANDDIGSNNWSLVNTPTFPGTGDKGIAFVEASTQYATLSSVIENVNNDFTIFVALPDITTAPANFDTIFSIGDAVAGQNDYVALWQLGNGNLVLKVDNAGGNTLDLTIANASLPASHALYMVRRSGTTWRLECITNAAFDSGTYSDTLTLSESAIGARVKQGAFDNYLDDTILAMYSADVAITNSADITAVQTYVQTTRGLSSV